MFTDLKQLSSYTEIQCILDSPFRSLEVTQYRQLVESSRSYKEPFGSPVRFWLNETDLVSSLEPNLANSISESTLSSKLEIIRKVLLQCDGTRSVTQIAHLSEIPHSIVCRIVSDGLGKYFWSPSIDTLHERLHPFRIVRWPCHSYSIDRNYWSNCAFLSEHLSLVSLNYNDLQAFVSHLRALHVILLMGPSLETCYAPASTAMVTEWSWLAMPGQMRKPGKIRCALPKTLPNAYFRLLAETSGALPTNGYEVCLSLFDNESLFWGQTYSSWESSSGLTQSVNAFYPSEHLTKQHLGKVWRSFQLALDDKLPVEKRIDSIATFFQRFVCAHVFYYGNMSLVMLIVNELLMRTVGGRIPHMYLDHCAQRLNEVQFRTLFNRVLDRMLVPSEDKLALSKVSGHLRDAVAGLSCLATYNYYGLDIDQQQVSEALSEYPKRHALLL